MSSSSRPVRRSAYLCPHDLRHDREWLEHAGLTVLFDDLTGKRLLVLVNGTCSLGRLIYLFEAFGDRLRLTDARLAAEPPIQQRAPALVDANGRAPRSDAEHIGHALTRIAAARRLAGLDVEPDREAEQDAA